MNFLFEADEGIWIRRPPALPPRRPGADDDRLEEDIVDPPDIREPRLRHERHQLADGDRVIPPSSDFLYRAVLAITVAHDIEGEIVERLAPFPDLEDRVTRGAVVANAVRHELRAAARH